MARVTISFTLDPQEDRRIIRYLEGLPRGAKSAAIREALDAHLGGGLTLGDVYQAVKELERKVGTGVVVAADAEDVPEVADEPPDIAAALDNLGL